MNQRFIAIDSPLQTSNTGRTAIDHWRSHDRHTNTHEADPGPRRHRQDRPPRRRAAHGARPAGAGGLALRRAAVRLGRPGDVGAGAATASGRSTSPTTPTSPYPARSRRSARSPSWPSRAASRGWCSCPAAASPKPSSPSRRVRDSGAELTILRSTWFSQNFSESYFLELVLERRGRAPGRGHAGAVRRRRRHRRRRGRRADRRAARRRALRADRPAPARRSRRPSRRSPPRPAASSDTCRCRSAAFAVRARRARRTGRRRRAAHLRVRRGPRRPQRPPGRRRPARTRTRSRATSATTHETTAATGVWHPVVAQSDAA